MADASPRILLVEDNELNREMLSRRLLRKGFEVSIAVDGLEGVAKASAQPPHLILMDMSLPGIDGWEATRRLKASPATQAVPVIALTAHAMSDDREKALAAGCDDFDTKPVDLERLLRKMQALLRKPYNDLSAPEVPPVTPNTETVLNLPAVADSLPALQTALVELCHRMGVTADVRADLQVVLDEVCANVFKHAYGCGEPGALQLTLRHAAGDRAAGGTVPAALELVFADQGRPFNPLAQAAPDLSLPLEERPLGGLGIHLVRELTDQQHYSHSAAAGNRLTLLKHLP